MKISITDKTIALGLFISNSGSDRSEYSMFTGHWQVPYSDQRLSSLSSSSVLPFMLIPPPLPGNSPPSPPGLITIPVVAVVGGGPVGTGFKLVWYSTQTPPGKLLLSTKSCGVAVPPVPVRGDVIVLKKAAWWAVLKFWYRLHIESVNPVNSQYSGALLARSEHIVPPTLHCDLLCSAKRNELSNCAKLATGVAIVWFMTAPLAMVPLNSRRRQVPSG